MEKHPETEVPEPGWSFYARLLTSQILALFLNPLFLVWTIRQACGQVAAWVRAVRPGGAELAVPHVRFPLSGVWRVLNGGRTPKTSHSWPLLSQRFAYDFTRNPDGASEAHPVDLAYWPAFGAPVHAVADGVVVAAHTGERDHPRPGSGWIDWRSGDPRGNYVTLRHGPQLYSLYAHLQNGSVEVSPGDHVAAGERIGARGNSGHSTEPHLHFQLQDRADFFLALGLPPSFGDIEIVADMATSASLGCGEIRTGQTVRRIETAGVPEHPATCHVPAGLSPIWVCLVSLLVLGFALWALIELARALLGL